MTLEEVIQHKQAGERVLFSHTNVLCEIIEVKDEKVFIYYFGKMEVKPTDLKAY